jgi:hypothetical protein
MNAKINARRDLFSRPVDTTRDDDSFEMIAESPYRSGVVAVQAKHPGFSPGAYIQRLLRSSRALRATAKREGTDPALLSPLRRSSLNGIATLARYSFCYRGCGTMHVKLPAGDEVRVESHILTKEQPVFEVRLHGDTLATYYRVRHDVLCIETAAQVDTLQTLFALSPWDTADGRIAGALCSARAEPLVREFVNLHLTFSGRPPIREVPRKHVYDFVACANAIYEDTRELFESGMGIVPHTSMAVLYCAAHRANPEVK